MAMRSKANIQTSWNSSEKIPIGACSGRKKQTKQSGSLILNHPNPILHTVPLFISILQRFDFRYHRNKWNHLNVQRSENWFHAQMIRPLIPFQYLFNKYSAPRGSRSSSSYFPLRHILLQRSLARVAKPALQSLQSTWQSHFFHEGSVMLVQKLLNLLLALINALFLHASTFLDIKFDAAMQQRFNRRARSRIFKWLGHVGLCLYAKGQVQVLQAWQIWGTPVLHLIAPQLALKRKLWAVTNMHRCDSCMMWQSCAGYSKHLQNKSLSSVHWKWDKLTQGQLLVLHFAILHLARTRVE